jgi:hypothetical protein
MNIDYYFSVADHCFLVSVPDSINIDRALPSFKPFKCNRHGNILFKFICSDDIGLSNIKPNERILKCDLEGGIAQLFKNEISYYCTLQYERKSAIHYLKFNKLYNINYAKIDWTDGYAFFILNSMIRIVYAQACIYKNTISLHSSSVILGGKAYLFLGKSGTGKSTHADMWVKAFVDKAKILNDDNPIIRVSSSGAIAYGSPWSGKRNYYNNEGYPIRAIVRLRQSDCNIYHKLSGVNAFTAIYPSCSAMRTDKQQNEHLFKTLIKLIDISDIGILKCLPNIDAALLCFKSINNK